MGELTGKRIIVTGAAEGIGWGIATVCAREGADLVLVDVNADLADTRHDALPDATWIIGDLSDDAFLRDLVAQATAGGRVDALVNNAAVNSYAGTPTGIAEADWDRVMGVNLRACWMLSRLLIPHMTEHGGGTLLQITSIHGAATYPAHFPYNVTKGAMNTLVQALAIDYADAGIRSIGLAPGWVHTANIERFLDLSDDRAAELAKIQAFHPSRRIGTPAEIGELASFLLSDRCPYINGTIITADGGLTAQLPS